MPVKNEPVGKLVMVSQSQRDMLVDIDDIFVSHLFTYGIQFDCDFWGILPNNPQDISRCLNPDMNYGLDRVQKALDDMERLGLIQYFGKDNFLIYVVDYGRNNYIDTLNLNFNTHSKKPKYEREMMIAVANGELCPTIMELPQIAKKGGMKNKFITAYLNKTLHKDSKLETQFNKLFYKDLYFGENKYAKSSTDVDIEIDKHQVNKNESIAESEPISVPILDSSNKLSNIKNTIEREVIDEKDLPF